MTPMISRFVVFSLQVDRGSNPEYNRSVGPQVEFGLSVCGFRPYRV